MNLTQTEYIERLVNMLPDSAFVGKQKMIFDGSCVGAGANMVEAIADAINKTLDNFTETDYVLDLRDATRNLAVLGRFLAISYDVLLGDNPP